MEINTRPLSKSEWVDAANRLFALLSELTPEVRYFFGIGADAVLEMDHLWKPETISSADLHRVFSSAIGKGIITPVLTDFFVEADSPPFETRICRSADIHFKSDVSDLLGQVNALWSEQGIGSEVKSPTGG